MVIRNAPSLHAAPKKCKSEGEPVPLLLCACTLQADSHAALCSDRGYGNGPATWYAFAGACGPTAGFYGGPHALRTGVSVVS